MGYTYQELGALRALADGRALYVEAFSAEADIAEQLGTLGIGGLAESMAEGQES